MITDVRVQVRQNGRPLTPEIRTSTDRDVTPSRERSASAMSNRRNSRDSFSVIDCVFINKNNF